MAKVFTTSFGEVQLINFLEGEMDVAVWSVDLYRIDEPDLSILL